MWWVLDTGHLYNRPLPLRPSSYLWLVPHRRHVFRACCELLLLFLNSVTAFVLIIFFAFDIFWSLTSLMSVCCLVGRSVCHDFINMQVRSEHFKYKIQTEIFIILNLRATAWSWARSTPSPVHQSTTSLLQLVQTRKPPIRQIYVVRAE